PPVECTGPTPGAPRVAAAGARWSSADPNSLLVGLGIEQATGVPFYELLRTRVLAPLHLEATIANDRRDLPGLACGMASGIGFHAGPVVEHGRYFTNPAFEYCGGRVPSTTPHPARRRRQLFAGDVIPRELRAAHRTGVPARRGITDKYGLGCFVTSSPHGEALGHSGVMPGYLSHALYYPDLQVSIAVQFPTDAVQQVGNLKQL